MQEWLHNNDILMYSTYNEGKSVIAEIFLKTLKYWICKEMAANDSKSYFTYLHKLVDQYNNIYHHPINKKPIDADYSFLTKKKLSWIPNLLNFKLIIKSKLLSIRIFLIKVALKIGQEKY